MVPELRPLLEKEKKWLPNGVQQINSKMSNRIYRHICQGEFSSNALSLFGNI